jgi:hypothetical protein
MADRSDRSDRPDRERRVKREKSHATFNVPEGGSRSGSPSAAPLHAGDVYFQERGALPALTRQSSSERRDREGRRFVLSCPPSMKCKGCDVV